MIGLEANVLVRHFVQDGPGQSRKATQVIAKRCTRDDPGFINRIVLCELVWVLESACGYSKDTIRAVVRKAVAYQPAEDRRYAVSVDRLSHVSEREGRLRRLPAGNHQSAWRMQ